MFILEVDVVEVNVGDFVYDPGDIANSDLESDEGYYSAVRLSATLYFVDVLKNQLWKKSKRLRYVCG